MSSDEKRIDARAVVANADTKNIDQAALFLAEAEGFEPLTAKQEQRLKRKIDFILIPMVLYHRSLQLPMAYHISSSSPPRSVPSTKSRSPRQPFTVYAKTTILSASSTPGSAPSSHWVPLLACSPPQPSSTSSQPPSTSAAAPSAGPLWHF